MFLGTFFIPHAVCQNCISAGVEIYEADEGLLADETELRLLVGAHTAVFETAPDTMGEIAAAFDEARLLLAHQVLPFSVKVVLGGKVWLPGLGVGKVHWVVVAVGIFVTQSTETVAELMYDYRSERGTVGIGECIAIVDSAAAITIAIDEHDDMLIRCAGQYVVHLLQMERGQVAGAVEGVKVGAEGRFFPDSLAWFADAALCRG